MAWLKEMDWGLAAVSVLVLVDLELEDMFWFRGKLAVVLILVLEGVEIVKWFGELVSW